MNCVISGIPYPWEQRKFSELYERVSEKNDLTYGKDDIISVANMYFKPDSYITDPEYLRTYNVFHLGDIAFEGNKSKNFAHGRFVENTIGNGIVSHVFDVFHPIMDYDLLFWKYAINNERIMGDVLLRCTKASTMMTNLVANDFLQESVLVPSVDEQRVIGAFLDQLDKLITLHQRMPFLKIIGISMEIYFFLFVTHGGDTFFAFLEVVFTRYCASYAGEPQHIDFLAQICVTPVGDRFFCSNRVSLRHRNTVKSCIDRSPMAQHSLPV